MLDPGPENAPPILLIHGFGASVGHFRKNIPVLVDEGFRVYAIDLLGFGASDKPVDVEVKRERFRRLFLMFWGHEVEQDITAVSA